MRAMVLEQVGRPLVAVERADPEPGAGEVLLAVSACAVCRTDLHVVDGELPDIHTPVIPGHEIVGKVIDTGPGVSIARGKRLGVPWLGSTCGHCEYCARGHENLCDHARFTGYQLDGGFADRVIADHRYCFELPAGLSDTDAAPLLCAGLIGYRCLRMAGDARHIGIYGFGAAAHIVTQVATFQGREIYAFTRPGDARSQGFARDMGAVWAGASDEHPGIALDAAIIFAPAGELVPVALKAVRRGGTVVCGGIHMSDIPSFPYSLLWGERRVCSVANLTRRDATEFLALAPRVPVHTTVTQFALEQANDALTALRRGQLDGAAVLVM